MEVSVPLDVRDPWEEVAEAEREVRTALARQLRAIDRLESRWPDDPEIADLASDLAQTHGWSYFEASERIRIAVAIRDLPHIARTFARGSLSWSQLRWVTRLATPDTDEEWSQRAPRMAPGELKLELERQRTIRRRQAERDHAMRAGSMGWDVERRFFDLHLTLAREQGAAVEASIVSAIEQMELDEEADDPRAARVADAAAALLASSGRASRPAVIVHTDAAVVEGRQDGHRHLAETSTGVQLTTVEVERIGCEATWLVAAWDAGRPLGLRTVAKAPTDHQMELLRFRDRGCTWPGCGSRRFLHAHHITHRLHGGKTTMENLTLLCGSHHRRVHKGGWTIRGRPPDGLTFVSRSGRVIGRHPRAA